MRKLFHSPEHQNTFMKNGYVIVDMLTPEEVKAVSDELFAMRPDDQFAPNRSSTYHCTFLDTNEEYKLAANALFKRVFTPQLNRYVADFEILSGNLYVKPPGKGTFEIHQNWMHVEDISITSLTLWCPLVDVNKLNGTLEVVPGSHKIVPDVACLNTEYYFHHFEDALIEKYLQPIELKAGQAVLFDDGLIHWSSQNDSDSPRTAIQIETLPKEATPVIYYLDPAHPEKGFEVLQVEMDFFIKNNVTNMHQRPIGGRSIGFKKNINRLISEEEFVELLKRGDEIRAVYYQ